MKNKIPNSPFSTRLSGAAKEIELRLRSILQWKKKRPPAAALILAALIALSCGSLVSCQAKETPPGEENALPESPPASQPQSGNQEKSDAESSDPQETEPDGGEPFSFAEIQTYEFYFSSGAGAWATTLMIHADGSFHGEYHDSDMGVTGEGYASGTQYYCAFQGQLEAPVKVNAYTYSAHIRTLRYENEVGTEEIRDGIRYLYSEAYGLYDAEEILIYLPGAPLADLPQGYRDWVGYHDLSSTEETQLPFYGVYNVAAQCGFSGYDIVSNLKEVTARIEEQTAEMERSLENGDLTAEEQNDQAQELYELWDYLLNRQWSLLKRILDEESMRVLTAEELEWIAQKEAAREEADARIEDGLLPSFAADQIAAEMTRDRVYELMELLD